MQALSLCPLLTRAKFTNQMNLTDEMLSTLVENCPQLVELDIGCFGEYDREEDTSELGYLTHLPKPLFIFKH
eukprot:CAMPEP_0114340588 /NCGR_PEP_ID=MMETSP0101-20121206/8469_1 /TAXON_ID=38822 ORGANISM="Pteridomonas danica, Strain PT" /NCGR_SAMPLE_ID=MMETSP0101 /ASSEMBLY_ACC=CAM_ASM_000211 /LENGTH=71 /DNA_ID=CAMNT_0001473885 /DNA_START=93 /DNA_END=308 /DNA_ORIENTATION=+